MSADKKGHLRISSFGNSLGISGEHIVLIPLGQLQEFRNHPFHVHDDERMEKLTESVRELSNNVEIMRDYSERPICARIPYVYCTMLREKIGL